MAMDRQSQRQRHKHGSYFAHASLAHAGRPGSPMVALLLLLLVLPLASVAQAGTESAVPDEAQREREEAESPGLAWNRRRRAMIRQALEERERRRAARRGDKGRVLQQLSADLWCAVTPWDSKTTYARFDMWGCNQITGIHAVETYHKTYVVIDRTDKTNTNMQLSSGKYAFGEEIPFTDKGFTPAMERPVDVMSNLFCSSGQLMPDGSLLSIGGSTDAMSTQQLANGSYSIRSYSSFATGMCTTPSCSFSLLGTMTDRRWYPTGQILPDGRVLIVGGSNTTGNVAINKLIVNNPTVEYWPRKPGEGAYTLQFLIDTVPYNLYAFVHVLRSGKVFIFAGNSYILFSTTTNQAITGTYPSLEVTSDVYEGFPLYFSYPMSATSALFPLRPEAKYEAEIMICGGASIKNTPLQGGKESASVANSQWLADYRCYHIKPEAAAPAWQTKEMCAGACGDTTKLRRVMGDAVLLADGSLLILNGGQKGFQGLTTSRWNYEGTRRNDRDPNNYSGYVRDPQLQPLIFYTHNYTWYPWDRLPKSKVPRLYHSMAILLHDASVVVSGSNPNNGIAQIQALYNTPSEFRVEKFIPPYLTTGLPQPKWISAPRAVTINTRFFVSFNATQASSVAPTLRFTFTLVYAGFSTHNQRHGMRNVNLQLLQIRSSSNLATYWAVLVAPPNLNIAPPTMYWLHMLDNGIPNVEAVPLNITRKS